MQEATPAPAKSGIVTRITRTYHPNPSFCPPGEPKWAVALFFPFPTFPVSSTFSKQVLIRIGLGEGILYWARVGVEIVRTTASQQRMSPLDLPGQWNEARTGLSGFFGSFINGRWRDVTTRQALNMAGRGAEILGFFTVGTMIGKRSIAGYKHVPQYVLSAMLSTLRHGLFGVAHGRFGWPMRLEA